MIEHAKQFYPQHIAPPGIGERFLYLDGSGKESLGGKRPHEKEVCGNGKNIPCPLLMVMNRLFPGGTLDELNGKGAVNRAVREHLYQRKEYAAARARNNQDVSACGLGLL